MAKKDNLRRGANLNREITVQQAEFLANYMVTLNATQAALAAGYSEKTAASQGSQLLQNAKIAGEINRRKAETASRIGNLRERVLAELSMIAFSDMRDYGDWDAEGFEPRPADEIHATKRRVIQEVGSTRTDHGVNHKMRLHSKEKALELLGRHIGLFDEDTKGEGRKPFVIKFIDGSEVHLGLGEKPEKKQEGENQCEVSKS